MAFPVLGNSGSVTIIRELVCSTDSMLVHTELLSDIDRVPRALASNSDANLGINWLVYVLFTFSVDAITNSSVSSKLKP